MSRGTLKPKPDPLSRAFKWRKVFSAAWATPSSANFVTRCSPEKRRRWLTSLKVTMTFSVPEITIWKENEICVKCVIGADNVKSMLECWMSNNLVVTLLTVGRGLEFLGRSGFYHGPMLHNLTLNKQKQLNSSLHIRIYSQNWTKIFKFSWYHLRETYYRSVTGYQKVQRMGCCIL